MKSSEIEKTKKYYDKNFRYWTERKTHSFHHEVPFTKILKLWPERGNILDIGCAHGIHVPLFLGIGRKLKYTGIDISSAFLKIAKRRYPQLIFNQADIADRSTLPSGKFSGFFAAAVLMHIPYQSWDSMFSNIESKMQSGAYGYISLPVAHPSGQPNADDTRHFTILDESKQRNYFKARGWKIVNSGEIDGFISKNVWRWYIVELPKKAK